MYSLDFNQLPAALYLRISDDREGRALGVKRQEDDGRALIGRLGVILSEDHIYVDNDISAGPTSTKPRADYDAMLRAVRAGEVKVIVAYSTSRLTRRPRETEDLIDIALAHGVRFVFVASPSYDLTTADGREAFRRDAVRDTGEVDRLRERIIRKKLEDAREGKDPGGRRRYGYGKIVGVNPLTGAEMRDPRRPVDDEIANLQEAKQRTLAGESQLAILRDWMARGIKTAYGSVWTTSTFRRTLLNESYVIFDPTGHASDCPCLRNPATGGTRIHHDDRHRAQWPGIFTRAEHEALGTVFDSRYMARWPTAERPQGRSYLLSSLLECGGLWSDTEKKGQVCGGVMRGQGKTDKRSSGQVYQRRYVCKKWDRNGDRIGCCTVVRGADPVEAYVTEQVLYRFDSPDIARQLMPVHDETRMVHVVQQLTELQIRREALAAEYAAGEHEKQDYQVMLSAIKDKIAVAESERKRLLTIQARGLAIPTDGGLRELWRTASLEWRAAVIKLVVEKVVIHPCGPVGKRWPDKNGWVFDPEKIEIFWLH